MPRPARLADPAGAAKPARPWGRVVRTSPRVRAQPRHRRPPARRPRVRLTGLGCGVLATAVMVAVAWLCELFGGVPTLYGVLFLIMAVAAAIWVRPHDLICAPIAAPIAFAAGLVTTHGLVDAVTELALRAPWLFAGTVTAAGLVLLRRALLLLGTILKRRRRRRRLAAAAPPR
ncbi:DUF6542 domain-containing protein [Streptomyces sp. 6N223]|uniref:DUF6542 domain-containing protein n=1 Tax=Streptomyces sp. 6N223 TaxID=3457412 RepID=UPI003FD2A4B9